MPFEMLFDMEPRSARSAARSTSPPGGRRRGLGGGGTPPLIRSTDVRARRLAARWVLPIEATPIEWGAVLIGPDGRFQAVGPDTTVPRPAHIPTLELEDSVLLPGLINTHTHLELTGFEGRIPDHDFPIWIQRL